MRRALAGLSLAALACAQEQVKKPAEAPAPQMASTDAGVMTPPPPPAVAAPAPATPAAPEPARPVATIKQSGAVTLLELPSTTQPVVTIALQFRTGAVDDPQGQAGITNLTAHLMSEGGTQSLDAKALLTALFPLAAEINVRVDKELTTFTGRVHKDHLAKFLPIFTDVVLHPRFDPSELKRQREDAVNDIEKRLRQGDDEELGKSALGELLYKDHPYGRLTLGHASDLKKLTLDDLKAHAAKVFTQDRLTIAIAGPRADSMAAELAQSLAGLPAKSAEVALIPRAQPHGPRFLLVEKLSDSTAISIGMPYGLSRKDPDWAAMSVARSAFGEHRQFNGRLMQRLREQRGLNYGDYAYLEAFRQEGGDASQAQAGRARHQQELSLWLRPVQDENRLFAVRAALYELQKSLTDEPFTAAEVEQTKGFLDGYLLLFDQTETRRLGYALDDAFYGMTNFLGTWHQAIRGVTADQVNAAWRKWVDPSKVEIVMAGKEMTALKQAILSNAATPIHYQVDASGKSAEKPAAQLATDKEIEKLSFGANGDADVQVVKVSDEFE
ncbi:MAG TPA: pitrilysin family protein [Myxococcales bacterium]|jgi:zinc protease|nr:pitrilysin family protein [Myxococcales bacterium]